MRRYASILCCTLVLGLLAIWAPGCRDVSEERYGEKSENDSGKLERPRRLFPDVTPSPPPSPTAGVEPEAEAPEAEAPEAEAPEAEAPEPEAPEAEAPEAETPEAETPSEPAEE